MSQMKTAPAGATPPSAEHSRNRSGAEHTPERGREQPDRVMAEIGDPNGEHLRVAVVAYRGHVGVDCRTYVRYRSSGQVGPTKAGVRIVPDELPRLIDALQRAQAELKQ